MALTTARREKIPVAENRNRSVQLNPGIGKKPIEARSLPVGRVEGRKGKGGPAADEGEAGAKGAQEVEFPDKSEYEEG